MTYEVFNFMISQHLLFISLILIVLYHKINYIPKHQLHQIEILCYCINVLKSQNQPQYMLLYNL